MEIYLVLTQKAEAMTDVVAIAGYPEVSKKTYYILFLLFSNYKI